MILEHPYVNAPQEEISLLQTIEKEHPLSPEYSRFKEGQARIERYNSPEFKQAEKARREASQPTTHVPVDFNRVWCPVYSKVRPEWLCASEHGDYHEVLDEEWEDE